MKHELIDLGNGQVYVVNIPTDPSEGSITKEDALILNLWERLKECKKRLGDDLPRLEVHCDGFKERLTFKANYLNEKNDDEEE